MATKRTVNYGTVREPLVYEWDTALIHKNTYDDEYMAEVFSKYVLPNIVATSDTTAIRSGFRAAIKAMKEDEKDSSNDLLHLLMALRLTVIIGGPSQIIRLVDGMPAKQKEIMYRNMIWRLNHSYKFSNYCFLTYKEAGSYKSLYYMCSEFEIENLPVYIPYDHALISKIKKEKKNAV